jgi:hypothetical protein
MGVADIAVVVRLVSLAKAVTGVVAGARGGVWISILELYEEVNGRRGWLAGMSSGEAFCLIWFQGALVMLLAREFMIVVEDEFVPAVTGVWGGVGTWRWEAGGAAAEVEGWIDMVEAMWVGIVCQLLSCWEAPMTCSPDGFPAVFNEAGRGLAIAGEEVEGFFLPKIAKRAASAGLSHFGTLKIGGDSVRSTAWLAGSGAIEFGVIA